MVNGNIYRCPHCGCVLQGGANFCQSCGKALASSSGMAGYQAGNPYYRMNMDSYKPLRNNPLGIIGFLLGLLGLLALIFLPFPISIAAPALGFLFSLIGTAISRPLHWGNGLALAGLVLSVIAAAFALMIHYFWTSFLSWF